MCDNTFPEFIKSWQVSKLFCNSGLEFHYCIDPDAHNQKVKGRI